MTPARPRQHVVVTNPGLTEFFSEDTGLPLDLEFGHWSGRAPRPPATGSCTRPCLCAQSLCGWRLPAPAAMTVSKRLYLSMSSWVIKGMRASRCGRTYLNSAGFGGPVRTARAPDPAQRDRQHGVRPPGQPPPGGRDSPGRRPGDLPGLPDLPGRLRRPDSGSALPRPRPHLGRPAPVHRRGRSLHP